MPSCSPVGISLTTDMLVKEFAVIHCAKGKSHTMPWHWPLCVAVKAAVQSSKSTIVAFGKFSCAHSSEVVEGSVAIFTPETLRSSAVG